MTVERDLSYRLDHDRLMEIVKSGVLERVDDPRLQSLVERAAEVAQCPIALVSIVLDEVQYFVAQHGLTGWVADARGTPHEWSFCVHTIAQGETLLIPDATLDSRFKDNPMVVGAGIRCYAGVPLTTDNGHHLGTICVVGTQPREFSPEVVNQLTELARQAMRVLSSTP